MKFRLLILFFALLFWSVGFSQSNKLKIDSLKSLLDKTDEFNKAKIYNNIADILIQTSSVAAEAYARQALTLSKKHENKFEETRAIYLIALSYFSSGDYAKALGLFMEATVNFKDLNNPLYLAKANYYVGNTNYYLSNYDVAMEYDLLALAIFNQINDIDGQGETNNTLGNVNLGLNDLSKAEYFYHRALKFFEKTQNQNGISKIYNNLAIIYQGQGKLNLAYEYLGKSLDSELKNGNLSGVATAYNNYAEFLMSEKKYSKALDYYEKSIKANTDNPDKSNLANVWANMGRILIRLKKFDEALPKIDKSLKLAKEIGAKDLIQQSYVVFSEFYTAKVDYKRALEYYKESVGWADSIFSEKTRKRVAEMQVTWQAKEKEREIELLSQTKIIAESDLKKQKIIIYSTVAIVLILFAFGFLLYRQNISKKKVNSILQNQNRDIVKAEQELRKANIDLQKNEERFRLIVQNLPVMISAVDDEGCFIFWNHECEMVTGYRASEMIGIKNEIYPLINRSNNHSINESDINDYRNWECELKCKDNTSKTISWSNVSGSVQIQGWSEWSIGIDMTDRNLFERSLAREKALLNSLINSIPDHIFYKDKNCVYLGNNVAYSKFFGVELDSFTGKTDFDMFPHEMAAMFYQSDQIVLQGNVSWRKERWITSSDGKRLLVDTLKVPFSDSVGNVLGLVGISRDITYRFSAEEELKNAKERAEKADKHKSAFLANISHDMRNPLNAIIGFSEVLTSPTINETERLEYIGFIRNSGNNLLALVNDIIDIAKIEAGQITIKKTNVRINKYLTEILNTYQNIKKKNKKDNVELILKVPENTADYTIYTDTIRFRQIMANILGNAIKFTDKGQIVIGYAVIAVDEKPFTQFYVKDTGKGIPKDKHEIIFDRFAQVRDSDERNLKGTGLGLAICKSLVELLDGKIWVESAPGVGSTFYFTLPNPVNTEPVKEVNVIEKSNDSHNWFNKTILIAEDVDMNYKVIEVTLRKTKVNIIWAKNGVEAINFCRENSNIDLILMDLQMPEMNGYEAAMEIKKFRPKLPIIAQTAFAMAGEEQEAIKSGCDDYIAKPIKPEMLIKMIHKYFV